MSPEERLGLELQLTVGKGVTDIVSDRPQTGFPGMEFAIYKCEYSPQ